MDLIFELIKSWGPQGALALLMWVMLTRSEEREKLKDSRIQLLENQLRESYGERIEAADRLSEALHGNAKAMDSLIGEIRSGKNAQRH